MMVEEPGTRYGYIIGITIGPEEEEEVTAGPAGKVTGSPGPVVGEDGTLAAGPIGQVTGVPGPVAGEAGTLMVEMGAPATWLNGTGVVPDNGPAGGPPPAPTAAGTADGRRPCDPESPLAAAEAVEFTTGL